VNREELKPRIPVGLQQGVVAYRTMIDDVSSLSALEGAGREGDTPVQDWASVVNDRVF